MTTLPYYPLSNTGANDANKVNADLGALVDAIDGLELAPHNNGIVDKTKFAVSYSATTRVFSLTISEGAEYWAGHTKYTPEVRLHTTTAHANTTGNWFLYYDSSGTLSVSSTYPDLEMNLTVAYVYYNASTITAVLFDERHPDTWDNATHAYQHNHVGSILLSGGTIADYTLDTPGDAALQFSVAGTVFDDESYRHTLTALADGGPYTIWYRSGDTANNEWSWDTTATVPVGNDGDDPYYNELSGSTWVRTAITLNNRWVNYWICATNAYDDAGDNYKHRFIIIMGQTLHSTAAAADSESLLTGISWGTVPFKEIVPLYKLTFRRVTELAAKNIHLDFVTRVLGENVNIPQTSSPALHSALSGRSETAQHPATAVSYDNTTSGLTATDVQAAIDEVSASTDAPSKLVGFGGTPDPAVSVDASGDVTFHYVTHSATSSYAIAILEAGILQYRSPSEILGDIGAAASAHVHSSLAASDGSPDPALSVDAAGNVGIGTSSPGVKLEVHANAPLLLKNAAGTALFYLTQNGTNSGTAYFYSAGSLTAQIGTRTDEPTYFNGGNVGIGTASPSTRLVSYDTASVYNNDPGNSQIRAQASATKFLSLGYDASANIGYIQPAESGVAWRNLSLVPNGGNVGIGTSSPNEKLDVRGDAVLYAGGGSYKEGLNLVNVSSLDSGQGLNLHRAAAGTSLSATTLKWYIRNRGTSNNLVVGRYSSGDSVAIEIDYANGNVGIGTASPDAPLTFAGGVTGRKISLYQDANVHMGLGIDLGVANYEFSVYGAAGPSNEGSISLGFVSHANPGTYTEKLKITAGGLVQAVGKFMAPNGSTCGYEFPANPWGGSNHTPKIFTYQWNADENVGLVIQAGTNANDRVILTCGSAYVGSDKIWHAGNDGTGSGLDADTVDGSHASAFLGVSATAADSDKLDGYHATAFSFDGHAHSYLALSGGTRQTDSYIWIDAGNSSYLKLGPNAAASGILRLSATNTDSRDAYTAQVLSTNGTLYIDCGSTRVTHINYYSQTDTYINSSGGQVGIGTSSPYANSVLHAAGGVYAQRLGVGIGSVPASTYAIQTVNNSDYANLGYSWGTYACSESDKTDIARIPDALTKVNSIKGITFKWGNKYTSLVGQPGVVVSAEDLDSLGLPGLVTKNAAGEYEMINMTNLIPLLVEAIRQLKLDDDSIKLEVEKLKAEKAASLNSTGEITPPEGGTI